MVLIANVCQNVAHLAQLLVRTVQLWKRKQKENYLHWTFYKMYSNAVNNMKVRIIIQFIENSFNFYLLICNVLFHV